MVRFFAAITLTMALVPPSFAVATQAGTPPAGGTREQNTNVQPISTISTSGNVSGETAALPPAPAGRKTVIGGAIRDVDPVRDQFTLKVFGGKQQMKILFDERTALYRDGKRVSLRDLQADKHASVETVLDGTNVFARSIHILSHAPEGECQGQVVSYDAGSGELTVNPVLSGEPIKLRVPAGTPIHREGQNGFSSAGSGARDLVNGTLISVKFTSNSNGRGIANQIAVLATPGSEFVFIGDIAFLDLHANRMVVTDPKDGKSYPVVFDPSRFPISEKLHQDAHVKVTTTFDGKNYVANEITVN